MELIYTDGCDKRFIELCHELDDYLNEIVGGERQRNKYNLYNTLEDIHDVILVMDNGQIISCGSFKRYDEKVAEIKRVFVKKDYRRKGFAKFIMQTLEQKAREKGYSKLILETGNLLKSALELYTYIGFEIIENYGQYADMPESICMEKLL
jgi:putative acetyltransferase